VKNRTPSPRHVFINCPFDAPYLPILRAIQFTLIACGYTPRCALEEDNAAEVRVGKIMRIIRECALSIHDISCTEPDATSKLPRFNMPFELGLSLGHAWHPGEKRARRLLILDRERYRYDTFLSDIAGQDIRSHGNTPHGAITAVRRWLSAPSLEQPPPGTPTLIKTHDAFIPDAAAMLREGGFAPEDFTFLEWSRFIQNWLTSAASPPPGTCPLCGK